MAKDYPSQLVDEMHELEEEYRGFLARRKANRDMLRNMLVSGHLNAEQAGQVEETYPERQRNSEPEAA